MRGLEFVRTAFALLLVLPLACTGEGSDSSVTAGGMGGATSGGSAGAATSGGAGPANAGGTASGAAGSANSGGSGGSGGDGGALNNGWLRDRYPADDGIASDAAVLFHDDFEAGWG